MQAGLLKLGYSEYTLFIVKVLRALIKPYIKHTVKTSMGLKPVAVIS